MHKFLFYPGSIILLVCCGQLQQKQADQRRLVEFSGFDINGEETSCQSDVDQVCTTLFVHPGDTFSIVCSALGGEAFQCDCHEYVCSKQVESRLGFMIPRQGATQKPKSEELCFLISEDQLRGLLTSDQSLEGDQSEEIKTEYKEQCESLGFESFLCVGLRAFEYYCSESIEKR